MSTITTETRLRLINELANLGTVSSSDLFFIQKSLKSYKLSYSDLVAGLPDNQSLELSSNKLTIKDLGVDTQHLANDSVDFTKLRNISTSKVIGRLTDGSGNPEEISILKYPDNGSNLDNALVTEKRIKDYIDSQIGGINTSALAAAWVCFDGSSGVAEPIFSSYNILSVTRLGVGLYTLTFENELDTDTYAVIGSGNQTTPRSGNTSIGLHYTDNTTITNKTTTSVTINTLDTDSGNYALTDSKMVNVVIYE
jgi:hypothetical protein